MKRKVKMILVVACAIMVALAMTACGKSNSEKSLTAQAFEGISADSGMHLEYDIDLQGQKAHYDTYVKDDNLFCTFNMGEEEDVVFIKDDDVILINEVTGETEKASLSSEEGKPFKQFLAIPEKLSAMNDLKPGQIQKGTKTIDGKEYRTETMEHDGAKAEMVFDDDGKLIQMSYENNGSKQTMDIQALDSNVPDDVFDVTKYSGKKTTDDTATSDSGSQQTIVNAKGGYTFKTGDTYNVEKSDQYTYVYMKKMDTLPFFSVLPMVKVEGATVDSKIDDMIKTEKDEYQERIASQPVKNTVHVGDRDVKGMDFTYSSEDGKQTIEAGHYFELKGDTFYSWNYSNVKGETGAKDAMIEAMETFTLD